MNRQQRRECARKHWRIWTTKTSGDGTPHTVCPMCACDVPRDYYGNAR